MTSIAHHTTRQTWFRHRGDRPLLALALAVLLSGTTTACGSDPRTAPSDLDTTAGEATAGSDPVGSSDPSHAPSSSPPTSDGDETDPPDDSNDDDDDDGASEESDGGPKFDIGDPPTGEEPQKACDLDVVFVIDNSRSMGGRQKSLAMSVPGFIETLTTSGTVDSFHLGVTTTDSYDYSAAPCDGIGSFLVQTGGEQSSNAACGPYASNSSYMTNADDLDTAFACAARPGVEGSDDERPMDALLAAVSDDLTGPGGCNDGFHRQDSLLAVVLITDEDDEHEDGGSGSSGDPPAWYEELVAVKGSADSVLVLSLVAIEPPTECAPFSPPPAERLLAFTEMFGDNGFVGDVCSDDYGDFFAAAVKVLTEACESIPE